MSILLVPLIAMQFSTAVQWTWMDFVVAGGLLITSTVLIELILRTKQHGKQRTLLILLVLLTLLIFWGEMAVGILK